MNAQLQAAFDAIQPELAARYATMYRGMFDHMVSVLGPELKGVVNSWQFARQYSQIRDIIEYVITEGRSSMQMGGPKRLNEALLAKKSDQQAHFAIEKWIGKINQKLGDLNDVSVNRFGGCEFVIFGSRNGKAIKIEQSIIVKSSSKGALFNQFPARIYVDGKFTSEAAYKAMFA